MIFTPEQQERIQKYRRSKDKAEDFFISLYGQRIAWIILANVLAEYTNRFHKSARTFDEAWDRLGYKTVSEIVFRAVNDLPCKTKDKGELSDFIKKTLQKTTSMQKEIGKQKSSLTKSGTQK